MNCPYCETTGSRRELHGHLTADHADQVVIDRDPWGRKYLELQCPACDEAHRREVKPRLNDPTFLEEYAQEIRIVAFDMFLYHWQGEHEEAADD